ncbi:Aldo/keto reductase [Ramaria rubella]|nr:Aldo/keto reductase [Ramaria rubella]
MPSRIPLIYGTATFGHPGPHVTQFHTLPECQTILDVFCKEFGYKELDVARSYGMGSSEEFLGQLELHGARIDTKAPPPLGPEAVKEKCEASVKALGPHKIRVYMFHAPDKNIHSLEDTLATVNQLYKEGHLSVILEPDTTIFADFGLSNFPSYEVAEVYTLCKERGWILPTVYQGGYNLFSRTIEPELIPTLRKYGIRFTAFSPLAGGLLAGSLKSKDDPGRPGGRFDASKGIGRAFRAEFAEGDQFEALHLLEEACRKHNITVQELALRWLQHHSILLPTDGIVIGASSVEQLRSNVLNSEKGPLPEDLVNAAEKAWQIVKVKAHWYSG